MNENVEVTQVDLQHIRLYYKYLAKLWWLKQNNLKKCDDCMAPLQTGEGYIFGLIEGNHLQSYRLFCESCMTKMLSKPDLLLSLKKNPDYLGRGLIQKAREYAASFNEEQNMI